VNKERTVINDKIRCLLDELTSLKTSRHDINNRRDTNTFLPCPPPAMSIATKKQQHFTFKITFQSSSKLKTLKTVQGKYQNNCHNSWNNQLLTKNEGCCFKKSIWFYSVFM